MRTILLMMLLLAIGCKKPSSEPSKPQVPELPSRTENGANVLACKVDGQIHIYSGVPTYLHDDGVRFGKYQVGNELFIKIMADESQKYNDNVTLFVYDLMPQLNKEYTFHTSEISKEYARYYTGSGHNEETYLTKEEAGFVKFTRYDSLVVAGVFQFTAYNPSGNKTEVTEGFFDISRK